MAGGGGGTEELNLVPYLDIMVNLIMFMVTVTAYLVQLKEAPIIAPTYGEGGPGGEQKPFLTVAIGTKEMTIVGGATAEGAVPIPNGRDGRRDFRGLTAQLRALKSSIPKLADNLVITADGGVPYKDVVHAMDAARSDASGDLFPTVTLAAQVNSQGAP